MSLFKPLNDFFSDIPVMADFRIPGTNKVISFDRHAANNVSMFAFRVTSNVGTDAQLETVCGGAFKSDHLLLAVGDKQLDGSLRSTAYIGDQEVTHIMPPEQVAAVEALKEQRRLKRLQNHDRARTRRENA